MVTPDGRYALTGGHSDGTVRMWRLADGTPVGKPIGRRGGPVRAVTVGALPDGTR